MTPSLPSEVTIILNVFTLSYKKFYHIPHLLPRFLPLPQELSRGEWGRDNTDETVVMLLLGVVELLDLLPGCEDSGSAVVGCIVWLAAAVADLGIYHSLPAFLLEGILFLNTGSKPKPAQILSRLLPLTALLPTPVLRVELVSPLLSRMFQPLNSFLYVSYSSIPGRDSDVESHPSARSYSG